jgi:methylenetetrahydrofolate--tRNA-(uracil-5-)-methyltransferase
MGEANQGWEPEITVIGGGLAGCEAAMRAAANGLRVKLYEMKPGEFSPAHASPYLAELVCSNSFRSNDGKSAVGLLKNEMRLLGSVVMWAAEKTKVPAGGALAVNREDFGRLVTEAIEKHPLIRLIREKVQRPFDDHWAQRGPVIVATGPLAGVETTGPLEELTGGKNLNFYDALAPIVTRDSLDLEKLFAADRYHHGPGGAYLNCPLNEEELTVFIEALLAADQVRARPFEKEKYFEGCLPIEVMASRGLRTLTFGPMKPVGLIDPKTGKRPAAVVQLRPENLAGTHYNLVGFQTRMTIGAQEKVLRLIPALRQAKFARYGAIHRNSYVNAPKVLDAFQRLLAKRDFFLAGQISGVEGYLESASQGLWAGQNASRLVKNLPPLLPPRETALGSLLARLGPDGGPNRPRDFCPSNVNFGLFPEPDPQVPKGLWPQERLRRAQAAWAPFLKEIAYVHAR